MKIKDINKCHYEDKRYWQIAFSPGHAALPLALLLCPFRWWYIRLKNHQASILGSCQICNWSISAGITLLFIRRPSWSLSWWMWEGNAVSGRSGSSALTMSLQVVSIFNSKSSHHMIQCSGSAGSFKVNIDPPFLCSPLHHLLERLQPDALRGRHHQQNEGEPEALRRDPQLNLLPENPLHCLLQQGRSLQREAEEPHTGGLPARLRRTKWLWARIVRLSHHSVQKLSLKLSWISPFTGSI